MFIQTTATKRILQMKKRIRIVQGGTSSSKTISILLYLIALAQSDKTPSHTSIISESMPHIVRGAEKDFLMIMKEHRYFKDSLWHGTKHTYTFETGSKIEFFGADQADKLRGGRRDRLFLNEANNVSFDAFEQAEVRTKDFIFIDYNPSREFWVFTEVMPKRDDWERIILTYKENEALSRQIIDSIEQRKGRKDWWKCFGLGELSELEGQIYKGWQITDEMPHEARLECYGLDFGYSNDPTALTACYKCNGGFIFDEILYARGLSNRQIAQTILNQPDAIIYADSAEPKSIDEIASYGINIVGAAKGQGSVEQGIQWLQDQKCSLTKHSVNLIKDYRNYMWQTDRDGKILNKPEHDYSHGPDSQRYATGSFHSPLANNILSDMQYEMQADELMGKTKSPVENALKYENWIKKQNEDKIDNELAYMREAAALADI